MMTTTAFNFDKPATINEDVNNVRRVSSFVKVVACLSFFAITAIAEDFHYLSDDGLVVSTDYIQIIPTNRNRDVIIRVVDPSVDDVYASLAKHIDDTTFYDSIISAKILYSGNSTIFIYQEEHEYKLYEFNRALSIKSSNYSQASDRDLKRYQDALAAWQTYVMTEVLSGAIPDVGSMPAYHTVQENPKTTRLDISDEQWKVHYVEKAKEKPMAASISSAGAKSSNSNYTGFNTNIGSIITPAYPTASYSKPHSDATKMQAYQRCMDNANAMAQQATNMEGSSPLLSTYQRQNAIIARGRCSSYLQ